MDKITTHSLHAFVSYCKKIIFDRYVSICMHKDCYICDRNNAKL